MHGCGLQHVGDDDAVVVDVGHRVVDDVDAGSVRQVRSRISSYEKVVVLTKLTQLCPHHTSIFRCAG